MGNKIVLEMEHITKRFPGVLALDDVSIQAYAGEILALCGENGAGKSTLMKILSGSYPESSYEGTIAVEGQTCHFANPLQSERMGIEMIYQEVSMHLDSTIAENIFMGSWLRKQGRVDWQGMNNESKKYIEMVGLDAEPTDIVRKLSTSQQQMVSIARALRKEPKILVLDEPTSPLTQSESEKLFQILKKFRADGMAIILITHKMDEVFQNADRVTVIRDGKSISSNLLKDTNENRIIADMVGREITNYYPKEEVPIGDVVLRAEHFSVAHKVVPGRRIIDDVSFDVRAGEILGVAGLVGAGRSELMNAVFGKDPKISGDVLIDGKKVTIKNTADAIRNGMALLTEDRKKDGIVGGMSIRENITLPFLKKVANGWMISREKEEAVTRKYFEALEIKAPGMETLVQQLSGGNQQKVVLSKWIAQDPKVLILDEPTRGY